VNSRVRIVAPTRLDWVFAASLEGGALIPTDYVSGRQHYQLFVPGNYSRFQAHPLLVSISSSSENPRELDLWQGVCQKYGVVHAVVYDAGDPVPTARRIRIALDVLDDVRRRLLIDTDRTYLAGTEGGGAVACAIAYALPEVFGGVVCLGGSGPLRPEAWLRDRVKDRLSVALVAPEKHSSRWELEQVQGPLLKGIGLRSRLWLAEPSAETLEAVYGWLESGLADRQELAKRYAAIRLSNGGAVSPEVWAAALLTEAGQRYRDPKTSTSGLLHLEGIVTRWPRSAAAEEARRIQREYDARNKPGCEEIHRQEQQRFALEQARVLTAALDALPEGDRRKRAEVVRRVMLAWNEVVRWGAETKEGQEAKEQVRRWKKEAEGG
jgi:hypothetical protein